MNSKNKKGPEYQAAPTVPVASSDAKDASSGGFGAVLGSGGGAGGGAGAAPTTTAVSIARIFEDVSLADDDAPLSRDRGRGGGLLAGRQGRLDDDVPDKPVNIDTGTCMYIYVILNIFM
jgi:hypothetical protein